MCARGSKSGVKNETPKLPETRESLGKIGILLLLKSNFPHTKFDFLQLLSNFLERLSDFLQWISNFPQQLSAFFNGFLLSSTDFCFLQWLSDFLQRLSNFPQQLSAFQEIRENLFTAASIRKITI
jgi:uncharacterized protein YozE (UPF0346 family)